MAELKASQNSDAYMAIDFGQIQSDGSLKTNSFPVGIPANGYLVCGNLLGIECAGGTTMVEGHTMVRARDILKDRAGITCFSCMGWK